MKLTEYQTTDFINEMGSDSPAPGGGSASAFCGAQGAALLEMVCRLTVGKKKYAEVEDLARETMEKAAGVKNALMEIIDRDTEAFNAVTAVFAMPKGTEEEKAARKSAMQEALKLCTVTPAEMMRLSAEGLDLIEKTVGKLNATAMSDLGCAVLGLRSCMQGAWLNVLINISGIDDETYCSMRRNEGEELAGKYLPLADRLYEEIKEKI